MHESVPFLIAECLALRTDYLQKRPKNEVSQECRSSVVDSLAARRAAQGDCKITVKCAFRNFSIFAGLTRSLCSQIDERNVLGGFVKSLPSALIRCLRQQHFGASTVDRVENFSQCFF